MTNDALDVTTVQVATKVIIHAGNARALLVDALQAAEDGDLGTAKEKLDQANTEIQAAHQTQTDIIQAEARGDKLQLSLLLTHAQDSLMVAMSEIHMGRYIIRLLGKVNELEKK